MKNKSILLTVLFLTLLLSLNGQNIVPSNCSIQLYLKISPASFNRIYLDTVRANIICPNDSVMRLKVNSFKISVLDNNGILIYSKYEDSDHFSDSTRLFIMNLKNDMVDRLYYKIRISSNTFQFNDSIVYVDTIDTSYKFGNNIFIPPAKPNLSK